jgi:serine/threonine-protein kinase
VKIADFGLAKLLRREQSDQTLTMSGMTLGTPRYMAPEQRAGGAVDGRADLFALAEVIAEALGGDREAPPALAELLSRARSSDPAARPASAAAMLGELARIARDEATVTAPELGAWVERLLGAPGGGPAHDRFGEALGEVLRVGAPPAHTLTGDGAAPLALRTTFVAERGAGGLTVWRRERPRPWAAIAAAAAVAAIAAGAGGWALARTGTAVGTGTAAGTGTAVGTGTAAGTGAAVGTGTGTDGVAGIEKEAAIEKGVAIKKEAKAGAAGGAAAARRSPGVGYLNVYAEPWAKVSVDGRDVGATPLMKLALPAGSHRVRLEHSPAAPVERMVSLTAGRTELLDVDLEHE